MRETQRKGSFDSAGAASGAHLDEVLRCWRMGVRRLVFLLFVPAVSACMNWSLAQADASTSDATTDAGASDAQSDADGAAPFACAATLAAAKDALDQAQACGGTGGPKCGQVAGTDECGCTAWVQDETSGAADTYRRRMAELVDAGCDAECGSAHTCSAELWCVDFDGGMKCR